MKISLRLIGLVGALIFGFAFVLTYTTPGFVEEAGKEFIRYQLEKEVRKKIEDVRAKPLGKLAGLLAKKYQDEIGDLKQQLEDGLPEKITVVVAEMRDLNCECRKKYEKSLRQSFEWRISSLVQAKERLIEIIREKYMDIVEKVALDFRIFTGTNTAVFAFLLLVSFLKAHAVAQLFLPATLLLVATIVSGYFYIFQQNWFFTILYNNYVGYGYIAYIVAIFLFLCDVVFNRARVTTGILNSMLEAVGRTATLSPC